MVHRSPSCKKVLHIIEALGLYSNMSTASSAHAKASPLSKDATGEPASGNFNYAAVVDMLLYLCGHSCPDIAFAVNQCACYTFWPTPRHELALFCIGRYLKGTMSMGLVMKPTAEPRIETAIQMQTSLVCWP